MKYSKYEIQLYASRQLHATFSVVYYSTKKCVVMTPTDSHLGLSSSALHPEKSPSPALY